MTREERALQLWSLLALAANNRQVLTYDIVARLIGVVRPSIGDFLRPIQQFCTEAHLPPLTCLVVSEQTGLPGEGLSPRPTFPPPRCKCSSIDGSKYWHPLRSNSRAHIHERQTGGDVLGKCLLLGDRCGGAPLSLHV